MEVTLENAIVEPSAWLLQKRFKTRGHTVLISSTENGMSSITYDSLFFTKCMLTNGYWFILPRDDTNEYDKMKDTDEYKTFYDFTNGTKLDPYGTEIGMGVDMTLFDNI